MKMSLTVESCNKSKETADEASENMACFSD